MRPLVGILRGGFVRRPSTLLSCRGCVTARKGTGAGAPAISWNSFPSLSVSQRADREFPLERIRNIGISAHIDSGKTTLAERLLFYSGRLDEMHEVRGRDKVGAKMDFMELERQRGITIQSAATYISWRDHNINIIDTPGHVDFTVEVERALRVLDSAILVLCGVSGVQSQTFTVTRQMRRYDIPFLAFVNKLDRLGANFNRVVDHLNRRLGLNAAPLYLPIGLENDHRGLVDVIQQRATFFQGDYGSEVVEGPIPEEMKGQSEKARQTLFECLSNVDEELEELYLNEQSPSNEQLTATVRRTCVSRKFTPVLCGSALKNKGVQPLLDAIIDYLPNPGEVENYAFDETSTPSKKVKLNCERVKNEETHPFLALAFKLEAGRFGQLTYLRVYQGCLERGENVFIRRTGKRLRVPRLVRMHADEMEDVSRVLAGDICAVFGVPCNTGDTITLNNELPYTMESMFVPDPVVSMSIKVADRKHANNFTKGLARFTREDPTFRVEYVAEAQEVVAHGMGELHLEIYGQRLEKDFGTSARYNTPVIFGKPKVAFRETLVAPYEFDFLHKKQSGGRGEYGRIIGWLYPLTGDDYTKLDFKDKTAGPNLPKVFVPSVKRGFQNACAKGPLAGYKVSGVQMVLMDGDHHIVDSSDLAFQTCAERAMRVAFEEANWQLIEPVMRVEVTVPLEHQSSISRLLSNRHAMVVSNESTDSYATTICEVPLNDMFGFTADLRGNTQGQGEFTMEYAKYCPARPEVVEEMTRQSESAKTVSGGKKKKR